jgi:hypothetical protein
MEFRKGIGCYEAYMSQTGCQNNQLKAGTYLILIQYYLSKTISKPQLLVSNGYFEWKNNHRCVFGGN